LGLSNVWVVVTSFIKMPSLLAKSTRTGREDVTIKQHLLDTYEACSWIFKGRILKNWCRGFRIQSKYWLMNLQIACIAHDLGKANSHFQEMVSRKRTLPQGIRHEHISALILSDPKILDWLRANPNLDVEAIISAVGGHHLKTPPMNGQDDWTDNVDPGDIQFYLGDAQIADSLQEIAKVADLPRPPPLSDSKWDTSWEDIRIKSYRSITKKAYQIRNSPQRKSFHAALKAGVIVSDSVASAMVRLDEETDDTYKIKTWVDRNLHRPSLTANQIQESIVSKRMAFCGITRLNGIQEQAKEFSDRAILLAGCGMGKTLAALVWAMSQTKVYDVGRLIYLYPTRGTANEGFRDYILWSDDGAALVTGTAAYEIESIRQNPPDSLEGRELSEGDQRLFALQNWGATFYSATVDQFLGFLQNQYGSLCLLPILLDSVVVLDEVHAYDPRMWAVMKRWLEMFDVPTLAMTASLSEERRACLEQTGMAVYPSPNTEMLRDLNIRETRGRYNIRSSTKEEVVLRAKEAYEQGRKVLWVVNTVANAQALSRELGVAKTYHSRFKLMDRVTRQREIVEAFRSLGPIIAVTTQVCEMSLDIDADMVITELAPASSLVQRFGRSARNREDMIADILVYEPQHALPYRKVDLAQARNFLVQIEGDGVSIRDLSRELAAILDSTKERSEWTPFYDGVHTAVPHKFREIVEHHQQVILDDDLTVIQRLVEEREPIDGYILHVPNSVETQTKEKWIPKYLEIVSGGPYDRNLGYLAASIQGI